MRFGVCIGNNPEKARILGEVGFDFAELGLNGFARMPQEEFEAFCAEMKAAGIPCEAANCFLPGDIKLMGEDAASEEAKREYVAQALSRADILGIKTLVFGSGGSRRIPDGMSYDEGVAVIADFLRDIVSPEAAKYGINIAIEPLRSRETNSINTVVQGIALADLVGRENISVLADIHHMLCGGEAPESIADKKGRIIHVHTSYSMYANPEDQGRRFPRLDDDYDQFIFMNAAHQAGCTRFSLEAGNPGDFREDAAEALAVFRKAWKSVDSLNS